MCIRWKVSCCMTVISLGLILLFGILSKTTQYQSEQTYTCQINTQKTTIIECNANQIQCCCSQTSWEENKSQRTNQYGDDWYFPILRNYQYFTHEWTVILSCIFVATCCFCCCCTVCTKQQYNQKYYKVDQTSSKPYTTTPNRNKSHQILKLNQYPIYDQASYTKPNNQQYFNQQKHKLYSNLNQSSPYQPIRKNDYYQKQYLTKQIASKYQKSQQSSKVDKINNYQQNYLSHYSENQIQHPRYIGSGDIYSQITRNKQAQLLISSNSNNKKPDFIPYQGIQGQWVQTRYYYSLRKTFGFYQCKQCQKRWMSAHSKKDFKQACKQCKTFLFPTYLWDNKNDNYDKNKQKKALSDNQKPHLKDLCEACKKGMCRF